ncbi:MAG TPA: GNAT family N-acetyltransferase [Povalibacter sp.]|nr:GNAT family N-acetyltransferase [Povalibacter sp.]
MPQRNFAARTATPADFAAVDSLLRTSYTVLLASAYEQAVLEPILPLIARANPTLLASGTYYVAESTDGSIVGCGGWTPQRPGTDISEPGIAHIRHFGTHPDWIRCGVGRAIYDQCEVDARNAGITLFMCNSSLNGEVFYSALGFERVRLIEAPLGNGIVMTGVEMRRRI